MAIPDLTKCLRLATAVAAGLAATMIAPPAAASSSAADYFRSRAMNRTAVSYTHLTLPTTPYV